MARHNRDSVKSYLCFIIYIFLLFTLPSVVVCFLAGTRYKIAMIGFLFIALLLFVLYAFDSYNTRLNIDKILIDNGVFFLFLVQILGYSLSMIVHQDLKYLDSILISAFSVIFYLVIKEYGKKKSIYLILKFGQILAIASVIAFLLVPLGLLPVIRKFPNPDLRMSNWYLLSFSNINMPLARGYFIRPSAIYDEPGQFALVLTFMLLINQYTIKDKKFELAYIIGGLSTSSLAFFITLCVYLVFVKRNFKITLLMALLLSIILIIIYTNRTKSLLFSRLSQMTIERIIDQLFSGNITKASNRTGATDTAKKILCTYPFFGIGFTKSREMGLYFADNFYSPYAQDGIIGGLLIQFPCIAVIFKYIFDKKYRGLSIVLMLNLLQRSFASSIIYLLFLYFLFNLREFNDV